MIGQSDVEFHEQFVLAPSQAVVREPGVVDFGVMMKRAAKHTRCSKRYHKIWKCSRSKLLATANNRRATGRKELCVECEGLNLRGR